MSHLEIAAIVFAVWNIIVFTVYGIDKHNAKRSKRRISESSLLLLAALMGGLGALFGMCVFRHKTKHLKFKIGVPLLLLLNVAAIVMYFDML